LRRRVNTVFDLSPRAGGISKVSERLGKLQRLVDDSLLLFVVADFGVTLQ
jgi:hypothetical protein